MLRIDRRALHVALVELARVAGKSPVSHVLETLHIEAQGDTVTLTSTDLADTLQFSLPAEVTCAFTTCLPAKLLAKLVKPAGRRPAGEVIVEPLVGNAVAVTVDGVTSKLAGVDPAEFPGVPRANASAEESILALRPASALRDALGFVLPAASKDATRPHLNTVRLDNQSAICTDGHRLHLAPLASPVAEPVLLSSATGDRVRRLLAQADQVVLSQRQEAVHVRGGSWQLSTKVVDAEFPPYRHVIPAADQPVRVVVESKALQQALAQVSKVADGTGVQLRVNGALSIGAWATAGEIEVTIPTSESTHQGEDLLVGVDGAYLRQAVSRVAEQVRIGLGKPLDPIRVDLPDGRLSVIMPMRL